ncbi:MULTISPECIES: helix-turn-helix domain-containing protein [unclassified Clostridium]|uniref:helix-turn-helix domain-containing protein n=1 Tax=unclassified Clostridium TaxID=2614128 RepID=UPI0025C120AF|nr:MULTISPECIES: helix-turn-helix transcriptional regulator [unclassified Clostridium]
MSFKFDICKNKKFLNSSRNTSKDVSIGEKLRTLRLNNNLTLKQLSNVIGISHTTLMHVEQNKINLPYNYWKMICDFFEENHISYLSLDSFPENSVKEKLLKIRAYTGAKSWEEVGKYIGYSEGFTIDLLTRYTPNANHLKVINSTLDKLKKR